MKTLTEYASEAEALARVDFVRYDPATSEILSAGYTQRIVVESMIDAGEALILGQGDPARHYVEPDTLNIREKQESPAILDGLTISGIPNPSTVVIEGQATLVTDGVAELSFAIPGTYAVTVESVRFLPKTFAVTYEDPSSV